MIKAQFSDEYLEEDYVQVRGDRQRIALQFFHLMDALRKSMGGHVFDAALMAYITSDKECCEHIKKSFTSPDLDKFVEVFKLVNEICDEAKRDNDK